MSAASTAKPIVPSLAQEIWNASRALFAETKALTATYESRMAYLRKLALANEDSLKKKMIQSFFRYARDRKYQSGVSIPEFKYDCPTKSTLCEVNEKNLESEKDAWFGMGYVGSHVVWIVPDLWDTRVWAVSMRTWFLAELKKYFKLRAGDTWLSWNESDLPDGSLLKPSVDPA
jgi:hypothetical protein